MKPRLSQLSSREAVQSALDEFVRLGRSAFLARYGFGLAREYFVIDPRTGVAADSKAIVAVALSFQYPQSESMVASDFSGGDATVAPILQELGYAVRHRRAEAGVEDWSREEVEIIVADYLSMLGLELGGQRYNKTNRRERLRSLLPRRSEGSIEFKHANISAVMLELGFPYIRGYKPRVNFQRSLLIDVVSEQVLRHRVLDEVARAASERPAVTTEVIDFARVKATAPRLASEVREAEPAYARPAVKRDYLAREASNRSLGRAGELFALDFERWRLSQLGAGQLAERVKHVSEVDGDGLGHDIQSFEMDGSERFIEVKTTAFGDLTPFFVSANELQFAAVTGERFRLYRLFDFRSAPRLFELVGPIDRHCRLDPASYRASFG